ncbi:MAG TPA: lipase family protein [Mariprofundaceae bacterium]|nr:lipase family protein [Mariprofundaceae bacterium]
MAQLEPKPLPTDLSFNALFLPNTTYEYLKDAASQPFRFDATGFETVNAWWLAELSLLAYVTDHDFVRGKLAAAGLPHCTFFEDAATDTQAFVCHNDDFAIACFRGTEMKIRDFLTDLNIELVPSGGAGRVHRGFKKALDSVWGDMRAHLDSLSSSRKIWFAGHSLGAALATLATARYPQAHGVYPMAAPRCGDKAFCLSLIDNHWRFVNNNDVVPMLPPRIVYRHAAHLVYITEKGELVVNPSLGLRIRSWLRGHIRHAATILRCWLKGDFNVVAPDDLNDHAPIYYVVYIWNYHIWHPGDS